MVKLTAGFTLGEFCSDGLVDELEWLLIDWITFKPEFKILGPEDTALC
jgi:hypothetical protein